MKRKSNPETLNVLHVVIGLNLGGIQEYILGLFQGMDQNRFRLVVCSIENPQPVGVGKAMKEAGFDVVCLGMKRRFGKTIREIGKIIRARDIHIIHAAFPYPSLYARLAGILYGVPVLINHVHFEYERKRWNRLLWERLLSLVTDMHIGVSRAVARQIVNWFGVAPEKVTLIYNGVDTNRFCPPADREEEKIRFGFDPARPVVGMVARPDLIKGHRYFFEAVKLLQDRCFAQFYVAGADESHTQVYDEAKKAGVTGTVRFLGIRRDIPGLLGATDIFALPTLGEGLGISILEAMAASCAVVVSDLPPVLEIVQDGVNGLVVPMRDSASLADGIMRVVEDHRLRHRLGMEGRRTVQSRFSVEKCVQETADLYEALWARKAGTDSR